MTRESAFSMHVSLSFDPRAIALCRPPVWSDQRQNRGAMRACQLVRPDVDFAVSSTHHRRARAPCACDRACIAALDHRSETPMKTIKGPAIFLAQFAGDAPPYNSLASLAQWAAGHGFKGVQIPSWDTRVIDLKNAATSKTYCEEVKGTLAQHGLQITELSTHLQGQLVAVHPAYDAGFDGFAAPEVRGDPVRRQKWA